VPLEDVLLISDLNLLWSLAFLFLVADVVSDHLLIPSHSGHHESPHLEMLPNKTPLPIPVNLQRLSLQPVIILCALYPSCDAITAIQSFCCCRIVDPKI
jgi:hypothetical protein